MNKIDKKKTKTRMALLGLMFLELVILALLLLFVVFPSAGYVFAGVGEDNVTVVTLLDVGNAFPEILNITINDENSIDLTPNSTTFVEVTGILRDFNGAVDIEEGIAEFFDNSASSFGAGDDNNNHYTNNTCIIDTSYGDVNHANISCSFNLQYYANNATWNFSLTVNDSIGSEDFSSQTETVNTLLALALPNTIDYGEVNSTEVSPERLANVTNAGNVLLNLTLSGYGATPGDGYAMNCSLGAVQNISIEYERYNLTSSTPGVINYTQFVANYTNLTSNSLVREFNLPQRQSDISSHLDDTNTTYWRIYVPLGVAGSCSGNIVFGAVESPAS